MAKTTDELIDLTKDRIATTLEPGGDVFEAESIAKTLEILVSTKRLEQFVENEKENNNG